MQKPQAVLRLCGTVMLGDRPAHTTHALHVHRGLYFCTRCGGQGSWTPRKLLEPCSIVMTGSAAISRIRRGVLPSGVRRGPDERLTALLDGEDVGG